MNGAVVIFVDYGCEGWQPKEFENAEAAAEWIAEGSAYGSPIRVFSELKLKIDLAEE